MDVKKEEGGKTYMMESASLKCPRRWRPVSASQSRCKNGRWQSNGVVGLAVAGELAWDKVQNSRKVTTTQPCVRGYQHKTDDGVELRPDMAGEKQMMILSDLLRQARDHQTGPFAEPEDMHLPPVQPKQPIRRRAPPPPPPTVFQKAEFMLVQKKQQVQQTKAERQAAMRADAQFSESDGDDDSEPSADLKKALFPAPQLIPVPGTPKEPRMPNTPELSSSTSTAGSSSLASAVVTPAPLSPILRSLGRGFVYSCMAIGITTKKEEWPSLFGSDETCAPA